MTFVLKSNPAQQPEAKRDEGARGNVRRPHTPRTKPRAKPRAEGCIVFTQSQRFLPEPRPNPQLATPNFFPITKTSKTNFDNQRTTNNMRTPGGGGGGGFNGFSSPAHSTVGGSTSRMQLPHSLKAPGLVTQPLNRKCVLMVSSKVCFHKSTTCAALQHGDGDVRIEADPRRRTRHDAASAGPVPAAAVAQRLPRPPGPRQRGVEGIAPKRGVERQARVRLRLRLRVRRAAVHGVHGGGDGGVAREVGLCRLNQVDP
jgi:hypothetical protein